MQIVECSTDLNHWDVVKNNLVLYHSYSYVNCQAWAFGTRPSPALAIYSERLARIIDHQTPSGV